jgi:Protein of unknown function (DUF3300)
MDGMNSFGLSRLAFTFALLATVPVGYASAMAPASTAPGGTTPSATHRPAAPTEGVRSARAPSAALDQIVAPIAVYPDVLVTQILVASTYPVEVVDAERWLQLHAGLKGSALIHAVSSEGWDPSVKGLTQFPAILSEMDEDLPWTSALGDSYASEPRAVLNAIQRLRVRAEQAGTLRSTPQQTARTQARTVTITPVSPDVVYLPEFDPWLIYGQWIKVYPYWFPERGLYAYGSVIKFGQGAAIGASGASDWGWRGWGTDWHQGAAVFNQHVDLGYAGPNDYVHHPEFADAGTIYGRSLDLRLQARTSTSEAFDHAETLRPEAVGERASLAGGVHPPEEHPVRFGRVR